MQPKCIYNTVYIKKISHKVVLSKINIIIICTTTIANANECMNIVLNDKLKMLLHIVDN